MTDFLLELRSEEIPARMQDKAGKNLAEAIADALMAAGVSYGGTYGPEYYVTPRRLAVIVRDIALKSEAITEERKGPRVDAPAQALEGFLRSTGLTRDQLEERDDGKGNKVLFAVTQKPGRATADVLAEAIPAIIRAFPWPKSMRWGQPSLSTESLRWVRPLQGIVALLGDDVVPFEIAGIASGAATVGHRFHHPGVITIGNAGDYADKLRACHVLVDQDERRTIIRERASALAVDAGLELIEDEGLVAENAGLTEWPVPLLGRFDAEFLQVPPEVIQLTARVNQKYFVCRGADGKLADAFVCTANIDAVDGGAKIVEGNRKVLAARLSDAKFFWEQDLKVPLEEQAKKLDRIVFHEKLGTVADKVDRVAKLARWLVEEGIVSSPSPLVGEGRGPSQSDGKGEGDSVSSLTPSHPSVASLLPPSPTRGEGMSLADQAERAARLAKADLVTGMVGEFPELQGLMGGYYARAQGEPDEVADAVRDHYKPVGQGDGVPAAPVTIAVSLADKLDTVFAFFAIEERPTGSKDPFALRRAILGIAQLVIANAIRLPLKRAFRIDHLGWIEGAVRSADKHALVDLGERRYDAAALDFLRVQLIDDYLQFAPTDVVHGFSRLFDLWTPIAASEVAEFAADRLKVQQREAGVRHDLIDAVFALGGEDDLVRLLARVHALQAFVTTEDGTNLLAGYKRAANILKKEGFTAAEDKALSYEPEPAESALIAALDSAEPRARDAVGAEDFEGAMAALASLRGPIDRFFDDVTVNDPDPAKRAARLALLARVRDAVHAVADFSRIEG